MVYEPAISIVIPTYNDERFVGFALDSVFAQTYRNWEIIVVDDGSTDGSVHVARQYGDRVKVFEQSNSGSAAARNRGIQESMAPYVAFLDADDFWLPHKLEAQMKYLASHPESDFIFCAWREWHWPQVGDPNELVNGNAASVTDIAEIDANESGWLYPRLLLDCFIQTSTVLVRKSFLERVGVFDTSLKRGQDYDLWLRCSRATPIAKISHIGSLYRLRNDSITKRIHSVNYGGMILERAVSRWGMQDSRACLVSTSGVRKHIGTVWRNFAIEQAKARYYRTAVLAVLRAIRWWPLDLHTWGCMARIAVTPFLAK